MQNTLSVVKSIAPVGISAYTAASHDYVGNYSPIGSKDDSEKNFEFYNKSHKSNIEEQLEKSWLPKKFNDFIKSPSFNRLIYLATSALPLILTGNIVIGLISIVVALCFTIYGLSQDTKRYREMRSLKEEGAILSALTDSKGVSKEEISQAYKKKEISYYNAANTGESLLTTTALNALPLTVSVLSGNAIQAGVYAASMVTNVVGAHRNLNAYEYKKQQIMAYNQALAEKFGIEDYKPGMSLEALKKEYAKGAAHNGRFEQYSNKESSSEHSFLSDMGGLVAKGFKISKFQKGYIPEINPFLDKYHFDHAKVTYDLEHGSLKDLVRNRAKRDRVEDPTEFQTTYDKMVRNSRANKPEHGRAGA